MPKVSYEKEGLILKKGKSNQTKKLVKDLQRDLRSLGYLKKGIDGAFGGGSERAVKALQYDLLNNFGSNGKAPVIVVDYNKSRVHDIDGEVNKRLAACINDMLSDENFCKVPFSENPVEDNKSMVKILSNMKSTEVPMPFLLAMFKQESNLKHFREPTSRDEDNFVTVGLDTNSSEKHITTSRGYGLGQYTIFYHPPRKADVKDFINNVKKNVTKAVGEFCEKFDKFVNGATSGVQADDRLKEFGKGKLRLCKYNTSDSRYLNDCQKCLLDAGQMDVVPGTPYFKGSKNKYKRTQYYWSRSSNPAHKNVPIRKNIECDWPYAARRYNGAGINSYHYQSIILTNVLKGIKLD